ncbi:hypothetical protein Tco_0283544, partial [Tanacetum coccineum]
MHRQQVIHYRPHLENNLQSFIMMLQLDPLSKTPQLLMLPGISLTEAEEEAAARQVHATHARIVSESIPEPARRRRRQPGTGGSDEGTGEIPGVPDESIYAD